MDSLLLLTLICYAIALVLQIWATTVCAFLFFQSAKVHRWAWLALCLGLGLMTLRRINPFKSVVETGIYNIEDAVAALPISICLLLGVLGLRRLFIINESSIDLLTIMSAHDPLTGAYSRVESLSRLSRDIKSSMRTGQSIAVLELDIDYFKKINDHFGHQVGDDVLRQLVKRIQASLRASDYLGRIGGEEFLIVLSNTSAEQAMDMGQRIRSLIAQTPLLTEDCVSIDLTVSIGVAIFTPSSRVLTDQQRLVEDVLLQADKAMYRAKQCGRNQVVLFKRE